MAVKAQVKFNLGRVVATPGALRDVPIDELTQALRRHVQGDWGDVPAEDKRANNDALKSGARVLSAYQSAGGTKFWIITEAEPREATTFLLPEEY